MKKLLVIVLIISTVFLIAKISKKQNINNRNFLLNLDKNILETIDLLTTFNDAANNMPNFIKGINKYKSYLMEMTIECSKLRKSISDSDTMTKDEREKQISLLIKSLKPDIPISNEKVSKKQDKTNSEYLDNISKQLNERVGMTFKDLMLIEKSFLGKKEIPDKYFRQHSRLFLFSLLLDFIDHEEYLSRMNRDQLMRIIRSMEKTFVYKKE